MRCEHELFVYSREFPGYSGQEMHDGCTHIRVPAPSDERRARYTTPLFRLTHPRRSPFSASLFYPQYYRGVGRDMARRGVEIVHIHSFPQAASIIRSEHPSAKIIVHFHMEWLNLLPRRIARRQLRDVDLVLTCSEHVSDKARRALPEFAPRIRTLYNSVDVAHFRPPTVRGADDHTVLFVGRLSPEKGVHVLLEAFGKALQANPALRLDIIGDDNVAPFHYFENLEPQLVAYLRNFYDTTPWSRLRTRLRGEYPRRLRWLEDTTYSSRLRHLAERNGGDRVRFLGHVPNEQLPEHYGRAAVCVLPSLSETFGIPLVEAMACGTPTIASHAGGMTEIVQHQLTGMLVNPGDAADLAAAILRLTSDAQCRETMSEEARRRAVSHFSFEQIVDQLLKEYSDLCPEPSDEHRVLVS